MLFSLSAAALLALSSIASTSPTVYHPQKQPGLHNAMVAKGRQFFGTALTIREDPAESKIINNHADFGSVTPENAMKWESTEPSRKNFTFAGADAVVEYAAQYKKQIHCHTLVWHNQLPTWISEGNFDNNTLISIMMDHIKGVAGRYKGKCDRWDVVNEALNEDGSYRESVFYNTIGEAYIPIAFRIAASVDPHAKLFYNDYNLEYAGNKTLGAQRIVKLLHRYKVRIGGVGLQAHLTVDKTPTNDVPTPPQKTLEKALRTFTGQGIDVVYTELDIRLNTPANATILKAQAAAYARVAGSCLAVKRCIGITAWGVSNKYSWIPGVFAGEGAALIWDENYKKKPAYAATLKAIKTSWWAWW